MKKENIYYKKALIFSVMLIVFTFLIYHTNGFLLADIDIIELDSYANKRFTIFEDTKNQHKYLTDSKIDIVLDNNVKNWQLINNNLYVKGKQTYTIIDLENNSIQQGNYFKNTFKNLRVQEKYDAQKEKYLWINYPDLLEKDISFFNSF